MRTPTKLLTLAAAGLIAAAATTSPATAAPKKPVRAAWAPADTATIHPGVQMYTEGAQCTANFVFTDSAGTAYVGYAAHCAGTGAATDTNGCDAGSLPLGTEGEGWSHPVYTLTPGVPGDSGSAFLDAEGNAVGTLSTLALAPLAGSNGVGDLAHELSYAQASSGIAGLRLVPGTEPFSPIL